MQEVLCLDIIGREVQRSIDVGLEIKRCQKFSAKGLEATIIVSRLEFEVWRSRGQGLESTHIRAQSSEHTSDSTRAQNAI